MGLLKKLGKAAADAAKQGALNSVAKSIYTKYLNPVANTSTTEYYDAVDTELQSTSTFSGDMSLYDYKNTVDKSGKQETINIEKIQNESTGLDKNNLFAETLFFGTQNLKKYEKSKEKLLKEFDKYVSGNTAIENYFREVIGISQKQSEK